jgi:hypothetical protein
LTPHGPMWRRSSSWRAVATRPVRRSCAASSRRATRPRRDARSDQSAPAGHQGPMSPEFPAARAAPAPAPRSPRCRARPAPSDRPTGCGATCSGRRAGGGWSGHAARAEAGMVA